MKKIGKNLSFNDELVKGDMIYKVGDPNDYVMICNTIGYAVVYDEEGCIVDLNKDEDVRFGCDWDKEMYIFIGNFEFPGLI